MEAYDIHTWTWGVGVLVLVALLGYLFRGFLQEAGKDIYSRMFGPSRVPAKEGSSTLGTQYVAPPTQGLEPTPHLPDLTLSQIKAAIANAPPMQRDYLAKQYVGIRVDWVMYLRDASEENGKIHVRLTSNPGRLTDVTCTVDAHDYPQFRFLQEDVSLRVCGVIDSWSIGKAELTDARLTFLPQRKP